ncbi:MAG TPA: RNA 2',3'-cyclic phosphodiesterase [Abditibacteriaceae bacterium]|jgi:2'-5' RNA ligase
MRLFVALPLSPGLREIVTQTQDALRSRIAARDVKWVTPANIHLTLHFLGETAPAQKEKLIAALAAACSGIPPLNLQTGALGSFPDARRPRVIYWGLQGDLETLADLQARVSSAVAPFGAHQETKPFTPHLTLGRVKSFDKRTLQAIGNAIEYCPVSTTDWLVQNIELISSELTPQGPIYSVVSRVAL